VKGYVFSLCQFCSPNSSLSFSQALSAEHRQAKLIWTHDMECPNWSCHFKSQHESDVDAPGVEAAGVKSTDKSYLKAQSINYTCSESTCSIYLVGAVLLVFVLL